MTSIALWVTIISFAALASSIGLTLIVRGRRVNPWIDWYLVYAAAYALWAIIYAYNFFATVYEASASAGLSLVIAWIRALLSGAIILSVSMITSRLAGDERAARVHGILGILLGLGFTVAGLASVRSTSFAYAAGINVGYNLLILVEVILALRSARKLRESPENRLLAPVLWVSVFFYGLAVVTGIALVIRQVATPVLSTFAISAYLLPWAIVSLARQSAYLAGDPSGGVPASFAGDYGLTPREFEVMKAVAEGMSNARIAETQFVSVRTVEAHLYNVYRKVGVSSRTELLSLLRRIT